MEVTESTEVSHVGKMRRWGPPPLEERAGPGQEGGSGQEGPKQREGDRRAQRHDWMWNVTNIKKVVLLELSRRLGGKSEQGNKEANLEGHTGLCEDSGVDR